MAMPICPVCRAAMLPGDDGAHHCRRNPGHVLTVSNTAGAASSGGTRHCPSNMACPLCEEEMVPVPGRSAAWHCTTDPRHEFEVRPTTRPPLELIRHNPLLDRAKGPLTPSAPPAQEQGEEQKPPPFWLAHIGITMPLLPPLQSNMGPGDYCQPKGDIAPGGGSKSGKRKKKPKKPPLEPWGA